MIRWGWGRAAHFWRADEGGVAGFPARKQAGLQSPLREGDGGLDTMSPRRISTRGIMGLMAAGITGAAKQS